MELNHPEWRQDNSLTTPSDKSSKTEDIKLTQGIPPLSETEVKNAMDALDNRDFVKRFVAVERKYADPVIMNQKIGLISFVPAKGATPNKDGIYGFAKLRGNYDTDREAMERAEYLIRNVDSYHQIYHTFVGRPFPLTLSSKYSAETNEVDVKEAMMESINNSVKTKREEEKKQVKEIKEREKMLLEDVKKDKEEDPLDRYITLKVKKAQITWTFVETKKKLEEMKNIVRKAREELAIMDASDSTLKDKYFQKYQDARKESGLDASTLQDNFIKFMVEDFDIEAEPTTEQK